MVEDSYYVVQRDMEQWKLLTGAEDYEQNKNIR